MVALADVRAIALAYGHMLSADDHDHALELWQDGTREPERAIALRAEVCLLDRLSKLGALRD